MPAALRGGAETWLLRQGSAVNSAGRVAGKVRPKTEGQKQKDGQVSREEPIFNVPTGVMIVLAILIGVHVLLMILPEPWSAWLTVALSFIPARYDGYAEELPGGVPAAVTSFLTYAAVHGDLLHLAINSAWLLAFGGVVAGRIGTVRFLLFFSVGAVAGAIAFLLYDPTLMAPMVGASGAVSGLMGATMRFLFSAMDTDGLRALREDPARVPLMPLGQALTDRRVLLVTGAFLFANILAVMGLGGVPAGGIAWQAHLGGYFFGLFCYGFFERAPRSIHQAGQL
jgi:membrane associated rhomboid family serine protease